MLPNIEKIKIPGDDEEVTLQDMAGFNDRNRSYKGVFMVSYVLKRSFHFAEDARFILVCEAPSLMVGQIEEMIKPFQNFVEMFKKKDVYNNEDVMNSLVNSVVLVITKSDQPRDTYKSRLEEIVEYFEEE